jgi:hypothetical protein
MKKSEGCVMSSVFRIGRLTFNSNSKSSAIFVGVIVGFLSVCTIRIVASS